MLPGVTTGGEQPCQRAHHRDRWPPLLGETLPLLKDPFGFTLARTRAHGNVWKTRLLGDTVVFFAGPAAYSFFMDPGNFSRQRGTP